MESTYDKLIKAAIEIMKEEGYAGTSIGMIATKVGISKITVIH
jgi:AcrR family transcriptional regulator